MELQNILLNRTLAEHYNGKTVSAEIKSVSKDSLLLNLPNGSAVVLKIPEGTENFSQGDKIELPLNLVKDLLQSQISAIVRQENLNDAIDKLALQAKQAADNVAEFQKYAQAVLKSLETASLSTEEIDFTKAILREIERKMQRFSNSSILVQNLPKTADTANFLVWAANQIKNGNLPVTDLFSIPQILLNSPETSNNKIRLIRQDTQILKENTQKLTVKPDNPEIKNMLNETTNKTEQNNENNKIQFIRQNIPKFKENILISTAKPDNPEIKNMLNETTNKTEQNNENNKIQFIQQNTQKFKENILILTTKSNNPEIKNMLNEMTNKIEQNNDENFAFVKINGKTQTDFLPVTLQTRFNSEFSAILSKSFPQLPKELFIDTANIIRNSALPKFALSQNLLENVKDILQDTIKGNENPNPQHKITPAVLSNLLIYANNSENRQIILPILKTFFAQEKSIENIFVQIKSFVESFEAIPKETFEQGAKITNENLNPQTKAMLSEFSNLLNIANSAQNKQTALPVIKALLLQENFIKETNIKILNTNHLYQTTTTPATTPAVSNLLNFVNNEQNGQIVLPILKSLFSQENSVETISTDIKKYIENLESSRYFLSGQLKYSAEKLNKIQNIFKNTEMIFQKENPIEYIISKTGILYNKTQKNEETLKNVLKEIMQQIKTVSQKLQNIPNLEGNEKLNAAFNKLKNLTNLVNSALRKIDGANLLANKATAFGRIEQTIMIPVQIAGSWIQIELNVINNKDEKNKHSKSKKQAEQVEINIELEKGNSVSAKANLTLEKQLQVSINFTNDKMLEWFKKNYEEFCESLRSIGTKSISVIFNKEKTQTAKEQREILISRFDIKG